MGIRSLHVLVVVVGVARPAQAMPDVLVVHVGDPNTPASTSINTQMKANAVRLGVGYADLTPSLPPKSRAPSLLQSATEAFHKLKYAEALRDLDAAIREAARTGASQLSARQLADLFVYRAHIYTIQGDELRGWDDFVAAATIDASRKLDAARFPPRVLESFGRAATSVQTATMARGTIRARQGCNIRWDGTRVSTRTVAQVPLGWHYVAVTCGQQSWASRVQVNRNEFTVTPQLSVATLPTATDLARRARRQGYRYVLWLHSHKARDTVPVLTARLLRASTAGLIRRQTIPIATRPQRITALAKLESMLQRVDVERISLQRPVVSKRRFYRRPWFWVAVGTVAAAAVIVPLSRRDSADGFHTTIRLPSGGVP